MLRGFHPCHIGTLDFALDFALDFLAEFFGGRFSVAKTALTAEKHTPKIRGKIRWKNSVKTFRFSVRFRRVFRHVFRYVFGEQLFSSKSEKFVQNPFCKRDPLTIYRSWPDLVNAQEKGLTIQTLSWAPMCSSSLLIGCDLQLSTHSHMTDEL